MLNIQTKVVWAARGASEGNIFPSIQRVSAFACENKFFFTPNFHTPEHLTCPSVVCEGLRACLNCYAVHGFVCGVRSEGVLDVQWLLRVQFPIVWKDELAARVTLHAVVCPDR